MKLAISGKGGVGKTTVAALMIRTLDKAGKHVLAIDADPDANLAAALGIDAEFMNINQLVHKESNRIEALKTELSKIGSTLFESGKSYKLTNTKTNINNLLFSTYSDHRMAMCFAPLVLKYDTIAIENPEIVNKSYPSFWDDFKKLNFAQLVKKSTK